MVLTESMARKFFQNQNPIGKALQVDHQELSGTGTYFVTGIVRDFPPNSTFAFDCLTATPKGSVGGHVVYLATHGCFSSLFHIYSYWPKDTTTAHYSKSYPI